MAEEKVIGIDLGTSNSAAAALIGGKPTIIPSAEGATQYGKSFPSYVAFSDDGEVLVGVNSILPNLNVTAGFLSIEN